MILAGVGTSLMTRRGRANADRAGVRRRRRTLWRRALFLLVLGYAFMPLWPGDILHYYAFYMAIGSFFLLARDRALWLAAIVSSLAFVVLLAIFDFESGWDFDTLEYTDLLTVEGALRNLLYNGLHPVVPWAAFFLLGMWLGRRDLRDDWLRQRLLYSALGVAIGIELLSIAIVGGLTADYPQNSDEVEDIQAVFGTGPIPPMPQYLLAGGATAIVVICTSVAATARRPRARWATPFIATGQMALTLYLAHVLLGMGPLALAGRLEDQTAEFSGLAAGIFSVLAVAFCWWWRSRFARGPLEWVMRRAAG